eukprot:7836652-Pyramimonas_sp.AAC.2
MMSDRWETGREADAKMGNLFDAFLHYDCLGRGGSGNSNWGKDARSTRGHLSGPIDGPRYKGHLRIQPGSCG